MYVEASENNAYMFIEHKASAMKRVLVIIHVIIQKNFTSSSSLTNLNSRDYFFQISNSNA